MDTVRRRIPFKAVQDDEDNNVVLDEQVPQEQDEVVQRLRAENTSSDKLAMHTAYFVVGLSGFIHTLFLLDPSRIDTLVLDAGQPLPIPRVFLTLSLLLHANLLYRPAKLSYQSSYALACVAPTLCLFLGKSWKHVAWWSFTPVVMLITQMILDTVTQGQQYLESLEALKYTAPGA